MQAAAILLVNGIIGDYYPMPSRSLKNSEKIFNKYLEFTLYNGVKLADSTDVFPTEGGSAAMCYIFHKQTDSLKHNILQINSFFQYSVAIICKTIPLFIMLSFLKIILSNAMSGILDSWIVMATIFACYALITLGDVVYTCIRCRLSVMEYVKQVLPVFAVSLPTSSGIAVSLSFLVGMVGIAVSSVCRVNDVMLLDRSLKK